MSGQPSVDQRPDAALKARIVNVHVAAVEILRMAVDRESIATLVFEGRKRNWTPEDSAKAKKRRSLIEDNPASG